MKSLNLKSELKMKMKMRFVLGDGRCVRVVYPVYLEFEAGFEKGIYLGR